VAQEIKRADRASAYFEAITVMDLPVIIGATYILTVFFLISIFVADLLYGYFDPRVRTG